jgi:hypothetical protein
VNDDEAIAREVVDRVRVDHLAEDGTEMTTIGDILETLKEVQAEKRAQRRAERRRR